MTQFATPPPYVVTAGWHVIGGRRQGDLVVHAAFGPCGERTLCGQPFHIVSYSAYAWSQVTCRTCRAKAAAYPTAVA